MRKFPKRYIALQTIGISLVSLSILLFYSIFAFLPDEDGVVLLQFNSKNIIIISCIAFAIILLSLIYSIFYYKKHSYQITDSEIILNHGIIFKRKGILPYNKINNIKIHRNLLHWLFGLEVLKLDSGAALNSENPEIKIVGNYDEIESLDKLIKQKMGAELVENEKSQYKFTFGKMLGYSYLRYTYLLTIGLIIFFSSLYLFTPISAENTNLTITQSDCWIDVMWLVLILSVLIPTCCIVGSFIKYFNFNIIKNPNSIDISYGLFEKKKNTINFDKIRAIKICQSLSQRILKTVTLKVEVIGFGSVNDNNETNDVLLPYIKQKDLKHYIDLFFSKWNFEEKKSFNPPQNTYGYFVSIPFIIINFLVLPIFYAIIISVNFYLALPTLFIIANLLILIICLVKQKSQKLAYNDDYFIVSNGYFSKKTIIINKKDIVQIHKQTTSKRKKKGLCSYMLVYFNTFGDNVETISIISDECFDEIINMTKI